MDGGIMELKAVIIFQSNDTFDLFVVHSDSISGTILVRFSIYSGILVLNFVWCIRYIVG